MTIASTAHPGFDLRRVADALAPGEFRFDPFGLVSGYKAYRIYIGLSEKSDAELAALGLDRADLPRVAIAAANDLRAA